MLISLTILWALSLSFPQASANFFPSKSFVKSSIVQVGSAQSQSPELAEAKELVSRVVKLYGERKYEEALPLAKRALQIREKVLSPDDQLVRSALVNLAELYLALGKYGDAESPFDRVITSYRNANPNDVRLINVLDSMALVQYAKGNLHKAESAYQESLRINEKTFGSENPGTVESVFKLAEFYQFSGKYEKAVPYYQRLLSFREKSEGPKRDEQLAEAIDRYACALRKLNRGEEANNLEKRIYRSSADSGNRSEAEILGNVLNGRAISLPRPSYPEDARAAGVSGTVLVRVVIDEKGTVIRACALKGPRLLVRPSEIAAYRARFTPTKLSGIPVRVTGVITYNYVHR
ncbi:MAG TPA: TonB family protein [Pyrinomonadaceae bacterium]